MKRIKELLHNHPARVSAWISSTVVLIITALNPDIDANAAVIFVLSSLGNNTANLFPASVMIKLSEALTVTVAELYTPPVTNPVEAIGNGFIPLTQVEL